KKTWNGVAPRYYYFDNEQQKIRYICLDFGNSGKYDETQLTWLKTLLESMTTTDNYSVVIFTHGVVDKYNSDGSYTLAGYSDGLLNIISACNDNKSYYYTAANYKNTITCDFANSTCKVILVVAGHVHVDSYFYYGDSKIPVVLCRNSGYMIDDDVEGTCEETTMDAIDIDLINNKAYFTRFGKNNDKNNGNVREFTLPPKEETDIPIEER
ncbi:MAG: hypothetical protein IKK11_04740, partial [Oscillospiraceae bacterium]|nr:hypothetical protein [Oscillospiraceae bacterium]